MERQPIRSEKLRSEIRALEGRDLQLWSISLLVILLLMAGFLGLILPNLTWNPGVWRVDGRYLPQVLFGFVVLIVLFHIYALERRWALHHARELLVRELIRSEAAEMLSLLDPLTNTFNRRYLSQIITQEVSRADRQRTGLAFAMLDVDNLKEVNTRFGHLVGDRILVEVAQLMKSTFRNSDTIIRYGGDEFLAVFTATGQQQAQRAVERLRKQVDNWNQANAIPGYTMRLSCGVAGYTKGAKVEEVIEAAHQNMYCGPHGKDRSA